MKPSANANSGTDEYGFPLGDISKTQRQRLQVRRWTSHNQWTARYPTRDSVLAAPLADLQALAAAHGITTDYRADLWWSSVGSKCYKEYAGSSSYEDLLRQSSGSAADVVRQIELDLPRTFPEQVDFASALDSGSGGGACSSVFDGSRSSVNEALQAGVELGAVGSGGVHSALRRVLRAFVALHPEIGYLQVRTAHASIEGLALLITDLYSLSLTARAFQPHAIHCRA